MLPNDKDTPIMPQINNYRVKMKMTENPNE